MPNALFHLYKTKREPDMKLLHFILGILFSFCLILILLITSVEAVAYWTPGYYEKEY